MAHDGARRLHERAARQLAPPGAQLRRAHGEELKETKWLAGEAFSLADVSAYAMAYGMPERAPKFVNAGETPRFMDWHARMAARPSVKAAFAMPTPPRQNREGMRERMSAMFG